MDNETITLEDRFYVDPSVSMAEQDQFIDKFRNIQAQNQAQINRDTYNLGTPVSSNLGGLTGAEGRWNTQYQRPQVNAAIENLRQVNMQQALNTAMGNQQNVMAERLNQAKRAYYRAQQEASARDRAKTNQPTTSTKGDVGLEYVPSGKGSDTLRSNAPGTSVVRDPSSAIWDQITGNPTAQVQDTATGQVLGTYGTSKESPKTNYEWYDYILDAIGWLSPVSTVKVKGN